MTFWKFHAAQKGKLLITSIIEMYEKIPTLKCRIFWPIHAIVVKFGVSAQGIDTYNLCEIKVARGNDWFSP